MSRYGYGLSRSNQRSLRYRLFVWFLAGLTGWPLVMAGIGGLSAPMAVSTAAPSMHHLSPATITPSSWWPAPIILEGKITPDGNLVIPLIPGFTGPNPLTDGATLFGNNLQIFVYNLHSYQVPMTLTVFEGVSARNGTGGHSVLTQSFTAFPLQDTEVDIKIPQDLSQVVDNLTVDGVTWVYYHLTPFSLIPFDTNIGGLDLLAITVLIEIVVFTCPLILLARRLTHKAIFAPKFPMIVYGHVVLLGLLFTFFADYQFLDQTFGGVSYLVYPIIVSVIIFLWSLSLFNRAEVVEILKPDVMSGHRLRYLRWTQLVGQTSDGRTVIIDPRWRGFVYGLLGHWATLIPTESEATVEGAPAGADIENRETMAAHEIAKRDKKLRRMRPGKERPEDDFKVVNAIDTRDPVKLYWVDSDQPVSVEFPHLSWHHWVEVPAKLDKEGHEVVPKHSVQKLTWPHIVDGESTIRLAGIHYLDAPLAALGWSRAEDDFRLLERRAYAVYVLRSRVHSEADRLTEERIAEMLQMMEAGEIPMTEEEAWAATEHRGVKDRRDLAADALADRERLQRLKDLADRTRRSPQE